MYMSRIRLNPGAADFQGFWQKFGNRYKIHSMIWSFFADSDDRNRDFLYRQEDAKGFPMYYIVSEREPEDKSGLWNVESKVYDPNIFTGQKLSFVMRANPIVSKRDENGKQHRHDVVMDAKFQLAKEGVPKHKMPHISEIVQESGFGWLQRKGELNGFAIESGQVRADGYMNQKFYKPKGKHHVRVSTVEFEGLLSVQDPDMFKKALFGGIGPSKSFGCGLLMVRPVH